MSNPLQVNSTVSVSRREHDLNESSCLCKAAKSSILRISSSASSASSSSYSSSQQAHHHQDHHIMPPYFLYHHPVVGGTIASSSNGDETQNNNNDTITSTKNDRKVSRESQFSSPNKTCYLREQNRDDVDNTGFYWLPRNDTDYDDDSETESDSDSGETESDSDNSEDSIDDDGDENEIITRQVQFSEDVISEIHFIPIIQIREYSLFFYSCHELQKMKDEADKQGECEEI